MTTTRTATRHRAAAEAAVAAAEQQWQDARTEIDAVRKAEADFVAAGGRIFGTEEGLALTRRSLAAAQAEAKARAELEFQRSQAKRQAREDAGCPLGGGR